MIFNVTTLVQEGDGCYQGTHKQQVGQEFRVKGPDQAVVSDSVSTQASPIIAQDPVTWPNGHVTLSQGCENAWVFGILPMGSGFLPKTQFFRVFGGFMLFLRNLGLQRIYSSHN